MKLAKLIAPTFVALALCVPTVFAQSDVQIGQLTCKLENFSNPVQRLPEAQFACHFDPKSGDQEYYTAQVLAIGDELQFENQLTLIWDVYAPAQYNQSAGMLRGSYVGGAKEVALDGGIIAKELLGLGENRTTLQPAMFSGIIAARSVRIQFLKLE